MFGKLWKYFHRMCRWLFRRSNLSQSMLKRSSWLHCRFQSFKNIFRRNFFRVSMRKQFHFDAKHFYLFECTNDCGFWRWVTPKGCHPLLLSLLDHYPGVDVNMYDLRERQWRPRFWVRRRNNYSVRLCSNFEWWILVFWWIRLYPTPGMLFHSTTAILTAWNCSLYYQW